MVTRGVRPTVVPPGCTACPSVPERFREPIGPASVFARSGTRCFRAASIASGGRGQGPGQSAPSLGVDQVQEVADARVKRAYSGPYTALAQETDPSIPERTPSLDSRHTPVPVLRRASLTRIPVQHSQRTQRVPSAGFAGAFFHGEVNLAGVGILKRPATIAISLTFHQIDGLSDPLVAFDAGRSK